MPRPPALFRVAPDVTGLRTGIVNVFFIGQRNGDGWVLVDAGLPGWSGAILRAARKLFRGAPPAAIVLTHGHFDHIGGLTSLQREWLSPCYAAIPELPHINDEYEYPPADPSVGGLMARTSFLFPRKLKPPPRAVRPLAECTGISKLGEWNLFPTPGHCPGHTSMFRLRDGLLIAGDALIGTRQESLWSVWRQKRELRPPPPYFTTDWSAAYHSICEIQNLRPKILASGHGPLIEGVQLTDGLHRLVSHFNEVGLPPRGKYLGRTWPGSREPSPSPSNRFAG